MEAEGLEGASPGTAPAAGTPGPVQDNCPGPGIAAQGPLGAGFNAGSITALTANMGSIKAFRLVLFDP